ncbi:MAG TPA: recombinase family protein [Solirubrobacteraceae bacterium]|nr:recombinase family protein [Solirubrobacteraceae bacterium]
MPTAIARATTQPITEAEIQPNKRAWLYLRVSTDDQVNTDYHRDGLSLLGQQDEGDKKAAQLDARITEVFKDPGRSAFVDLHKRTDFLRLLEELPRLNRNPATFVDYVIVWSCSRWARDTVDHWQARRIMRDAGARFVSITEPIVGEDTPAAFLYESSVVSQNQYQSMQTGEQVKRGLYTKARLGGSYGSRRLGYIKQVDELADGRHINIVVPDPQRHAFVTSGFQLYATGEYSLSQLADELYRLGLRSRPTKRCQGGKVNKAAWARMLRNPYYLGRIAYKRGEAEEEVFEGRHEPLIDQATFDQVQNLLDEKRVAGERPQRRQHYLRGSVFCGDCGQRLTFGISTGKSGKKYAYFFCSARINGTPCAMRANIRPELIEQAIQRHYAGRPVQLAAKDVAKRTEAIEAMAAVSQQAVVQVKQVKTSLITKLKAQQTRLIRLHAEEGDDISGDAFREERLRMQAEIKAAEKSLAETEQRLSLDTAMLRMALELAQDVAKAYKSANNQLKRGYNQAFFKKLFVLPDEATGQTTVRIASDELTKPYAVLLAKDLPKKVLNEVGLIRKAASKAESGSGEPLSGVLVSNFDQLAEGGRFELPVRQ